MNKETLEQLKRRWALSYPVVKGPWRPKERK
jgi:hypothetical protein